MVFIQQHRRGALLYESKWLHKTVFSAQGVLRAGFEFHPSPPKKNQQHQKLNIQGRGVWYCQEGLRAGWSGLFFYTSRQYQKNFPSQLILVCWTIFLHVQLVDLSVSKTEQGTVRVASPHVYILNAKIYLHFLCYFSQSGVRDDVYTTTQKGRPVRIKMAAQDSVFWRKHSKYFFFGWGGIWRNSCLL